MALHRKHIHLQAEYPTSSSLERSQPTIFIVTFFRISDIWCKPRKGKSCGFEDREKWLLNFPCSLFPVKVEANSPRKIACATSDRSKDKENKSCQLQRAPSRQHVSKKRVLCQPWPTNPFSAITSQNQNSTKNCSANQLSPANSSPVQGIGSGISHRETMNTSEQI